MKVAVIGSGGYIGRNLVLSLKKREFDNYACTDNPMLDSQGGLQIFMKHFSENGNCYLDGAHCTIKVIKNGTDVKVRHNGSKESFIEKYVKENNNCVTIFDDKNDFRAAKYVRKLADGGYPIKSFKVGNNCKELDDIVDHPVKNISDILVYI